MPVARGGAYAPSPFTNEVQNPLGIESALFEEGTDRKEPRWAWLWAFNPSATTIARSVFAGISLLSRSCELSSLQNIFQG